MYIFILVVFLAIGLGAAAHGWRQHRLWEVGFGVLWIAATLLLFAGLSLWGEMLWFDALGFGNRFWTVIGAQAGLAVSGGSFGAALVWILTRRISIHAKSVQFLSTLAGLLFGVFWGISNWAVLLKFWERVPTGTRDPVFNLDIAFFLFTLPLLDSIAALLLVLTLIATAAAVVNLIGPQRINAALQSGPRSEEVDWSEKLKKGHDMPLQIAGGALVLALAFRTFVGSFHLMYSRFGVVQGPGWTDVHVRLPAYFTVASLLAVAGMVILIEAINRIVRKATLTRRRLLTVGGPLATAAICWGLGLLLIPVLFQWLYVQPNEVSVERPYIKHNIALTRHAFGLDQIEEQQFPVSDQFTQASAERNREVLSQVRLWDPRALEAVYRQFQEIRLYYEFADVDIDRYTIDGHYQQVMVSPREMTAKNLPPQSQTFVNLRFKYTHGYGLTMAPVNEFTRGGLPNLLVKDLPPTTASPDLKVTRPEIYYGELTDTNVVVNTREKEFDYPSGDHNVYTRYTGSGGVRLSNFLRKLAFGWKFDGTRFLLSGYPTSDSRIMFRRQIDERVRSIAPFLHFDEDAYVVLDQGKMYWIVDAYTTSSYYPYSEPFTSQETTSIRNDLTERSLRTKVASYLRGANYLRNSVKAVVDAFEGTVRFYVFDPDDPLIQVWQKVFPQLFRPQEEMPTGLREHIRYPEGLLLAQGLVYARYHMTDPEVFYNQEDLWVRATEKYYNRVQPVEPYYIMWKPPESNRDQDSDRPQFILMQPFTPKNRQVLIGWIAGMCDGENYGRLLSYRFPKEKRVLGTQQVETKIDQDPNLSKQLSLWDQRGSRVVRGNVLAIPVDDTLLYVEPIYLQAEAAAYPELRLVALMQNDRLSYADNFEDALQGLYSDTQSYPQADTKVLADGKLGEWAQRASEAFNDYLQALSDREFDAANRHLKTLSSSLEQLSKHSRSPTSSGEGTNESGQLDK